MMTAPIVPTRGITPQRCEEGTSQPKRSDMSSLGGGEAPQLTKKHTDMAPMSRQMSASRYLRRREEAGEEAGGGEEEKR